MSWNCPRCSSPTEIPQPTESGLWHCLPCNLDYVPGTTVAAAFPRPGDFRALLDSLDQAPKAARPLRCPRCHAASFRDISIKGYAVEACSTCGGLVLDPGEAAVLRRIGRTAVRTASTTLEGADGAVELLGVLLRLVP